MPALSQPTSAATPSTAPASGFSFNLGNPSSTATVPAAAVTATSSTATAPTTTTASAAAGDSKTNSGFSFGTASALPSIEKKEEAKPLDLKKEEPKPAAAAEQPKPAPPAVQEFVQIPSALLNQTLEEIILKWNEDLESQVSEFYRRAIELNSIDTQLRQSSERLLSAHDAVVQAEAQQAELDALVNYVGAQQAELEALLDMLEAGLQNLNTDAAAPSSDDISRARIYQQAADLQKALISLEASFADISSLSACTPEGDLPRLVSALDANLEALLVLKEHSGRTEKRLQAVQQSGVRATHQQERLKFSF